MTPGPFATPITPAELDWQADTPVALAYDDPYFSREDGAAESRHVFLDGNALGRRFAALPAGAQFVIAETGFGTGLNLLCAMDQFLARAPADSTLHFISIEKHPLRPADLRRAHSHWPQFAPLTEELAQVYPPLAPGLHRRWLCGGRIALTLIFADVQEALAHLHARVDAWFLDGFAPARNPDMWQPTLFRTMVRLSAPGASFATFTAAGFVRRGLAAEGFAVQRVPGFGRKREMLVGTAAGDWRPAQPTTGRAAIIGAGLAGATCARALAERGWQVTVFDPEGIAQGASGNLAGVVYTTPSPHATAQNRFYQSSYLNALHWLQRYTFPATDNDGALSGVRQYPPDGRQQARQTGALHSGLWPTDQLQACPDHDGLLLPGGGYIRPPAWCTHLLEHPRITLVKRRVIDMGEHHNGWYLTLDAGAPHVADITVLANAAAARELCGLDWLPLKQIRGQVTYCRATDASRRWSQAICHSGYLTPALDDLHCVGATFDLHRHDLQPEAADNERNLAELAAQVPDQWAELGGAEVRVVGERVGLRCQSIDFLPLAGEVPDARAVPHAVRPGLYMSIAHGSRGITGTPLCAELIAALVNDEPLPVDSALRGALAPARFILRQRKKQPEWTP
ncbi:bifunctional tRNA (5-methylaminomethyl-2-thiouridine)(34)-methyltransferase MnmD/FAD-dependent 5-carboxymethylaminomethyl-2-thiouridine(34) oxidoreductase MnmC [Isoalcanivorax indicus]|uniref:bifunctional tRNA (5-methylaminomethyl-2-thiouridine)(34)-methyltransferase MnmD/FAD-dependent 5-carboxymethylaminomethyl-2-thiouridine(34) oxidoreductase MnmC n=1 Tax=Isoalcanivorax indicus TaxID=2202653 RepID=UPI000DBAA74F|nr:bifunctional tRNA (5-methylaminomethyl-2-thiouridine)(34)-methyltransferase MnmD/FAD-dependent 5-carboxymethylaminomethyl-2-thiouridine(34) oxidoreductase MnmC [Isoalcanivorax indicus]